MIILITNTKICFVVADENITKATTLIYGIIGETPVPFPPREPDACKNSGITCPMIAGKEYKFKATLAVKEIYPAVQLYIIYKPQYPHLYSHCISNFKQKENHVNEKN